MVQLVIVQLKVQYGCLPYQIWIVPHFKDTFRSQTLNLNPCQNLDCSTFQGHIWV